MIRDCAGCGDPLFGDVDVCPKCGRATDLDSVRIEGPPSQDRVRDPGLAFLISLAVPGSGQIYCGARTRGVATLCFVPVLLIVALVDGLSSGLGSAAARAVLALYMFGFLDAYFTAVEINRGLQANLAENPRVAAVLNLVAPGFGYFYLAQRTKGLAFFFAFRVLPALLSAEGPAALLLGWFAELVALLIAADAFRLANRARAYALARAAEATSAFKLPAFVPLGCAGLLALAYGGLALLGTLFLLFSKQH